MSQANTFESLQPLMKVEYPTKSERKKRFNKIRTVLKKEKNESK
jgi:hypothetical protein